MQDPFKEVTLKFRPTGRIIRNQFGKISEWRDVPGRRVPYLKATRERVREKSREGERNRGTETERLRLRLQKE